MTDWLSVLIGFIALLLTIVVPLVAYLNNVAHTTRAELSNHKTHVAETYATKNDVKEVGDRMERQMAKEFDNLKQFLINRRERETL